MPKSQSESTKQLFDELRRLELPTGQYAVFGSGPMGVRGLREIGDVDVIASPALFAKLATKYSAEDHEHGLHKIQIGRVEILDGWYPKVGEVDELIASAEIIEGLQFVQLDKVLAWKQAYGRAKDEKDIQLLRAELTKVSPSLSDELSRQSWLGMRDYLNLLEEMATDPAMAGETLYVSLGEGDITASWLVRLFDRVGGCGAPRLGRVVLLRLDDDLITRLERRGELEDGFRRRLEQNIDRIQGLIANRANVGFEVRAVSSIPPFHGYRYGDVLLRGPWAVDPSGHYIARTMLERVTRDRDKDAFSKAEALFESAQVLDGKKRPFTIGLVVPLKEEWAQLTRIFPILKHDVADPRDNDFYYNLDSGLPDVRIIATFLGEMGPTPASQRASRLIDAFQPQLMVIVGIAGALESDVRLGDVVVATEINDFESTAKAEAVADSFEIRRSGKRINADYALSQAVIHFSEQAGDIYKQWQSAVKKDCSELNVTLDVEGPMDHAGHVASGNVVVAAKAFKQALRRIDRKFLAVEMEAAGVATASWERQFPVKWLSLRGISDLGDEQKKALDATDGGAFRKVAMRSAAQYLKALLSWTELRRRITAPTR